jgi:chromatin remodeling complex protein RSC6
MPTAKKTIKKTVKRVVRRVPKKAATAVQSNTAVATNVAPAVVTASQAVADTTTTVVQENNTPQWESTWETILEQTTTLSKTVRALNTSLKKVHKQWARALKDARKQSKKKRSSNTKRSPSGFAKPSRISSELCAFLGKPEGTEMARTEVTRLLTQYIKTNSLQDPQNKRKIVPDAQLTSLLQVSDNAELTYFNLQKYMKRHFPKSGTTTTASA